MGIELHFYPMSKILVAFERAQKVLKRIAECEAWGGPSTTGHDPIMTEIPTTPGDYVIWQVHPYRTPTWTFSKVKWGTRLRHIHPSKPQSEDVWYEGRRGTWISLKRAQGISPTEVKRRYHELYGKYEIPKIWVFNDFGPYAVRYFVDRNSNAKLDEGETLMGEMIHTTPENEAQQAQGQTITLGESHGCIHIKPNDRDRFLSLGVFRRGTPFRVHSYREPAHE